MIMMDIPIKMQTNVMYAGKKIRCSHWSSTSMTPERSRFASSAWTGMSNDDSMDTTLLFHAPSPSLTAYGAAYTSL